MKSSGVSFQKDLVNKAIARRSITKIEFKSKGITEDQGKNNKSFNKAPLKREDSDSSFFGATPSFKNLFLDKVEEEDHANECDSGDRTPKLDIKSFMATR